MARSARPGRLQRFTAFFARRSGDRLHRCDCEIWQPGDMAENVASGSWFDEFGNSVPGPDHLAVHRVVQVSLAIDPRTGRYALFLAFARFGPRLYLASWFRKITPRADAAAAADAAFLSTLKPHAAPAPLPIAARLKRMLS